MIEKKRVAERYWAKFVPEVIALRKSPPVIVQELLVNQKAKNKLDLRSNVFYVRRIL